MGLTPLIIQSPWFLLQFSIWRDYGGSVCKIRKGWTASFYQCHTQDQVKLDQPPSRAALLTNS